MLLPWKNQSIYLITGGVSSLGLLFAREIIRQIISVTLVLAGRSPLEAEKTELIEELQASVTTVSSRRVDVVSPCPARLSNRSKKFRQTTTGSMGYSIAPGLSEVALSV